MAGILILTRPRPPRNGVAVPATGVRLAIGQLGYTAANNAFGLGMSTWRLELVYRAGSYAAHYSLRLQLGETVGSLAFIHGYTPGRPEFFIDGAGGNNRRIALRRIPAGTTHKYAATYNGTTLTIELDGQVVYTESVMFAFGMAANPFLQIGGTGDSSGDYGPVRFWKNGALIAEYLFAETAGTTAADTSGNGLTMTFNNVTHLP